MPPTMNQTHEPVTEPGMMPTTLVASAPRWASTAPAQFAAQPVTTVAGPFATPEVPKSEPVHYSGAQYALAWGLIAAAIVVAVLLSRRDNKPRRQGAPNARRPPTEAEARNTQFEELHTRYQNRDKAINEQLLRGEINHDEAHRAWKRSKLQFFDDLHDHGYPQPGHRRHR